MSGRRLILNQTVLLSHVWSASKSHMLHLLVWEPYRRLCGVWKTVFHCVVLMFPVTCVASFLMLEKKMCSRWMRCVPDGCVNQIPSLFSAVICLCVCFLCVFFFLLSIWGFQNVWLVWNLYFSPQSCLLFSSNLVNSRHPPCWFCRWPIFGVCLVPTGEDFRATAYSSLLHFPMNVACLHSRKFFSSLKLTVILLALSVWYIAQPTILTPFKCLPV